MDCDLHTDRCDIPDSPRTALVAAVRHDADSQHYARFLRLALYDCHSCCPSESSRDASRDTSRNMNRSSSRDSSRNTEPLSSAPSRSCHGAVCSYALTAPHRVIVRYAGDLSCSRQRDSACCQRMPRLVLSPGCFCDDHQIYHYRRQDTARRSVCRSRRQADDSPPTGDASPNWRANQRPAA